MATKAQTQKDLTDVIQDRNDIIEDLHKAKMKITAQQKTLDDYNDLRQAFDTQANELHDMIVSRDKLRADYDKLYKSFALQITEIELKNKQADETISRITEERNTAHKRFQKSTDKIGDLTQDIRDLKVEGMSYAKIIREQRRDIKTLMRVINKIMDA